MATTRKDNNETFANVNESELCNKLLTSANQTVDFFSSKLNENGSYDENIEDLACYFKSPIMFLNADKPKLASLLLSNIHKKFQQVDGDFKTTIDLKSINPAYIEYWSYMNGWIVRAANRLNIEEITNPALAYLKRYYISNSASCLTNKIDDHTDITDVLTAAHHGLIYLEAGNTDIAVSVGNFLCKAFALQPKINEGFYLRLTTSNKLLTDFNKEQAPFYFVSTKQPNQLYFMIGYPAAYLAMLYKKTNNNEFLNAAKMYLDFALSCAQVYHCNFSHKIAWAASILYSCTGDENYLLSIKKISDYFISQQINGIWFNDDLNNAYDQSAEIACWFLDIVKHIKEFKPVLKNQTSKYDSGVWNNPKEQSINQEANKIIITKLRASSRAFYFSAVVPHL